MHSSNSSSRKPSFKLDDDVQGMDRTRSNSLFVCAEQGDFNAVLDYFKTHEEVDFEKLDHHGQTILHVAASSGNCEIMEMLIEKGADISLQNNRGDHCLHCAARYGQVEVLKFLKDKGVDLNMKNKDGETAVHLATRANHIKALEFLCSEGADVNLQEKHGDTALHTACWCGQSPELCVTLCNFNSNLNAKNNDNEAPIHFAAGRGNYECIKILINAGANIDILDKHGCTPLHIACRRNHPEVAMVLLHAGCQLDIVDQLGETPLHSACYANLVPVVQTMCAFGCQIDIVNKSGSTPLHIATRTGHQEAVRCLLLSGAPVNQTNESGVTAEVLAISQGQNEIAELLADVKEKQGNLMRQLMPNTVKINRIKMKVFGDSDVGKSVLIESLKCGFLGSLLRRAGLAGSFSHHDNPKENNQRLHSFSVGTSETVPPVRKPRKNIINSPNLSRMKITRSSNRKSTRSNDVEIRKISIPPPIHEDYTQGISVNQMHIPGPGDMSVWEFSGYEPYYVTYDNFIGDPNCVHLILIKCGDSHDEQLKQISFWLDFIRIRLPIIEPVGKMGRSMYPVHAIIVATHADKLTMPPSETRKKFNTLHFEVVSMFSREFSIHPSIIYVDSSQPMSSDMKLLRNAIQDIKEGILQHIPATSHFYEETVEALPVWQRNLLSFPVVTWNNFKDYVRQNVNVLACEEHLKELIYMLQLTGEVIFLEIPESDDNLVVINPRWLGHGLIGKILSSESHLTDVASDGIFNRNDLLMRPFRSSCGDLEGYVILLRALDICSTLEDELNSDDVEYEITSLICLSKPPIREIWDSTDIRFMMGEDGGEGVFGGVRLCLYGLASKFQLKHIFPRIQTKLRQSCARLRDNETNTGNNSNPNYADDVRWKIEETEEERIPQIQFWYNGFKCVKGNLEVLATAESDNRCEFIEIKARGQRETDADLFYFFTDTCNIVVSAIETCCPSIDIQYHFLSPYYLSQYTGEEFVDAYPPRNILIAQKFNNEKVKLKEITSYNVCLSCKGSFHSSSSSAMANCTNPEECAAAKEKGDLEKSTSSDSAFNEKDEGEYLIDILAFGSRYIYEKMTPGIELLVSKFPIGLRRLLASILDPQSPTGQDWCLLSVVLGQSNSIQDIENQNNESISKTDKVLTSWSKSDDNATLGTLIEKLVEIGRTDAVDVILNHAYLFGILPDNQPGSRNEEENFDHIKLVSTKTTMSSSASVSSAIANHSD